MSSANDVDLSIPSTCPEASQFHDQPSSLLPCALYTLVDLSEPQIQQLQKTCESNYPGEQAGRIIQPSPRPYHPSAALAGVLKYHTTLWASTKYEPLYFVCAHSAEWDEQGVYLVTLDRDGVRCATGKVRIKASEVGLTVANLQVGNCGWGEVVSGESLDRKKEYDGEAVTMPWEAGERERGGSGGEGGKDGEDDGPLYEHPPSSGPDYLTGVYALRGQDVKSILENLMPGPKNATRPLANWFLRLQGWLDRTDDAGKARSTSDLAREAAKIHARRCKANRWLHKTTFILSDTDAPVEDGLCLVNMQWDGLTEGCSADDLRKKGQGARIRAQRMVYQAIKGTQDTLLMIQMGFRKWDAVLEYPGFAMFCAGSKLISPHLLDEKWGERHKYNQKIFMAPNYVHELGMKRERIEYDFREAIRRFPWFCRMHRLECRLDRTYFIWVDQNDIEEKGVVLGKLEWDGNVKRPFEELLALGESLRDSVTIMRVPAKEAHQKLADIWLGKEPWEGTPFVEERMGEQSSGGRR